MVKLFPRHPARLCANTDILERGIPMVRKISWDSSTSLDHMYGRLIDSVVPMLTFYSNAHWETSSSDTKIASILLKIQHWWAFAFSGSLLCLTRSSATAEKQRVSCSHGGGLGPPAHSPAAPYNYTYAYDRIRKPQRTYVKRAVQSRTVCCRNVQLMPTFFLKLTKIRQRQKGKFVDFNDLTQVWRRWWWWISTNDLYC